MEKQTQIWIIKQKLTKKLTQKKKIPITRNWCVTGCGGRQRVARSVAEWCELKRRERFASWSVAIDANGELKCCDRCQRQVETSPLVPTMMLKRRDGCQQWAEASRLTPTASWSVAIDANGELKRRHWCQRQRLSVAIDANSELKRRDRRQQQAEASPLVPTTTLKRLDWRQRRRLSVTIGVGWSRRRFGVFICNNEMKCRRWA